MPKRPWFVALRSLMLVVVIFVTASLSARAASTLVLTIGDPAGDHAEIIFLSDKKSEEALTIRSVRFGVAGSRIQLSIDHSSRPLISTILSNEQCKFGDSGSTCEFAVSGKTALYGDIVHAFRLGLRAHLTLENAGAKAMANSVSLRGFAAAYSRL